MMKIARCKIVIAQVGVARRVRGIGRMWWIKWCIMAGKSFANF